jgi:DNA (cytosine-5)-methyltransferase 1
MPRRGNPDYSNVAAPKAIGITCGIGSMLVGARAAGFKVAGNVEWRKYYHAEDERGRNTFHANFEDAAFPHSKEQMTEEEFLRFQNADIALGHPECGNFSQLNANRDAVNDPGDIPLFCDLVREFRPRFFVMDDLPKSFIAFSMEEYHRRLGDYDLFPEWVSNWGYGNTQRARNRFFMLGALKQECWTFTPGEQRHDGTVAEIISDLEGMEGNFPNHDRHVLQDNCAKGLHLKYRDHRATWQEMRDYILNEVKEGGPIHYVGEDGSEKIRVGSYKGHWHGPAHVLTGGISGFHPRKGLPYTIRERARLQGFPDDFAFYGTVLDQEDGQRRWNHDRNMHMVRQTGKAMPIQFCTYVSEQIAAHITWKNGMGPVPVGLNTRVIQPNDYVSDAKRWYCKNVGYSAQEEACGSCWLARGCEIREGKGIALPAAPARLVGLQPRLGNPSPRVSPVSPSLSSARSRDKGLGANSNPSVGAKKVQEPRVSVKAPRVPYEPVPTTMMTFGAKK